MDQRWRRAISSLVETGYGMGGSKDVRAEHLAAERANIHSAELKRWMASREFRQAWQAAKEVARQQEVAE
jgi:hypothetical protein